MNSFVYYLSLYFSIGMMICCISYAHPLARFNVDRWVGAHHADDPKQGHAKVQMFLILFWPTTILLMKGRF